MPKTNENDLEAGGGIAEINSAGVILSHYRDRYGLNLGQVCDGICSKSKLSRLERGIRCVDSLTSSQLLERIGKTADQFEQLLNPEIHIMDTQNLLKSKGRTMVFIEK